ncbi:hypothetical protein PVMG_06040 [Plasmodium vivax Mauritania I]|uniref:Uncharacterized protein n=1 Tax=Plasmodium vivax Mauritania I TaxID=1035515 RepID=A0A0J9TE18_PLAVI|nr:hypothetical protein PVMG_06040 [Plasmodium vivax Mauritania I]
MTHPNFPLYNIIDIYYKEKRYSVEKVLRTRLLAKKHFKYEGKINDLKGYISDVGISTKSKYTEDNNYRNTDKTVNKKVYKTINKINIKKNFVSEQLKKVTLDIMENNEIFKKIICCKFYPFNEIDSHFDKKIKNIFDIVYKNENNRNSNKIYLRKKLYSKICLMFLPYILILAMGFFYMYIGQMEWSSMILFPLGIIMLLYTLIKGIKYARLKKKGYKK